MGDRKALGIKAGDTVRVHQKIKDADDKVRLQVFEGTVLSRKHGDEPGATFTVRKVASGVGVEKIFPLYSPAIDKIEIIKRAKVRRAKLYYIREKVAREIKRQMRRMSLVDLGTESDIEAQAKAEAAAIAKAEAEAAAAEAMPEVIEEKSAETLTSETSELTPEPVAPATETPAEETK